VNFYKNLENEKQLIFQKRMMLFLNEINIEAVQFELEELDTIFVAASAVIPIFGFKQWHYNNLSTVLIYPDHFDENLSFDADIKDRKIAGLVGTGRFKNQMILSRKALHHGFTNATDKGNTAIHEFVHLLDHTDGATDGIPERLLEHQYIAPWLTLMHKEMEAINNDTSDIRSYGGTSQTEFFAVASEYFFERPDLFKRKHPELYKML
jgi:Mlc titration factor MtfA (ptsG expression regulator)